MESSMQLTIIAILASLLFLCQAFLRKRRSNRGGISKSKEAPVPAGAWPVIGHLHLLECFTTNDKALASRPKTVAAKHMGYNYAVFGFAPYSPFWREMRKIATLELLSNRRLEMLKHVRVSELKM
ncbi:Cytochrome P450 superfamily, partial [Sesbania bispinosa]